MKDKNKMHTVDGIQSVEDWNSRRTIAGCDLRSALLMHENIKTYILNLGDNATPLLHGRTTLVAIWISWWWRIQKRSNFVGDYEILQSLHRQSIKNGMRSKTHRLVEFKTLLRVLENCRNIHLHHLTNLLLERQSLHQRFDVRIDRKTYWFTG